MAECKLKKKIVIEIALMSVRTHITNLNLNNLTVELGSRLGTCRRSKNDIKYDIYDINDCN